MPKAPRPPAPSVARPHTPAAALPAGPSATLPAWAALCFFASGAAGLLYEIAWSKQLAYVLGSSLHAVATVTAAFLCGLAIGARVLGVPIARRGNGARTYALLELGVALLGVGLLPLLRGVEPLFGQLYRQFGGESAGFAAVRFALLFLLLIPPTALMGATLPVLVEHFERDVVGPALARLYALNTFGAVAGSALGGFALMPGLGLAGTTYVAGALNLAVAALAWVTGGRARAAAGAARPAAAPPAHPAAPARGGTLVLAALFALSGFAAMAFQIAWVRLYSLVFGSSVYSFAGVLGVYLLGLALGSAAVSFAIRRGARVALLANLQLALAASVAAGVHFFPRLPDAMFDLAAKSGGDWGALFTGQLGLVALLLLVPCALLGAVFPVAARLLQRGDGAQAAGFAYAVNTAGTIAGSLVAGFVLVPVLGVQGTHVAALALSGAIGLAALALARARGELRAADALFGATAAIAAAALAWSAPPWDPGLMSAGAFRPQRASDLALEAQIDVLGGSTVRRAMRSEHTLYYREGQNGSVLVGTDDEGRNRWLQVGGKVDASLNDMETQVLLGLLPAALADSGARSLVVGLGSGYTLAAALAGGAGPTEVVELERGVVEASEYFHAPGTNPLRDPRVTLVLGDARTHLAHTRAKYGLIVSEPSNPWIAGVNNLFTVDFYRRVKERLEPDGVFCQWMQLYEISPETIRSMMASYLQVFPEGEVFTVWRAVDVLLVANPGRRGLSLARLGTPEARRMLQVAKIADPEDVAAYWTGPLSSLAPLARGATLNRDDRPIVEYRAPRDLVAVGHAALRGEPGATRLVPLVPERPAGPLFGDWAPADWYTRRVRNLIAQADSARARAAIAGARSDGLGALANRLAPEVSAGMRRRQSEAECAQASNLIALGRKDEGRLLLEQAVKSDPTHSKAWLMLADRRRLNADLAGAEAALGHVEPGHDSAMAGDAAFLRGMLLFAHADTLGALRALAASQGLRPTESRAWSAEARLRAVRGDVAGAKAVLRRGLKVLPGNLDLTELLKQLGD
jgi:spermidine synthase